MLRAFSEGEGDFLKFRIFCLLRSRREITGIEYEVYLKDGSEIKFDKKSNWEKVECREGAVPATIVPEAITTYVRTHFPGETITQIERDGNKYEVELSNRLELKFDRNGRFLKIDR